MCIAYCHKQPSPAKGKVQEGKTDMKTPYGQARKYKTSMSRGRRK
jgi:hypothetical protein